MKARRIVRVSVVLGIVAVAVLALGAATSGSSTNQSLFAYVVPTNRGPLPACDQDGSNCTAANGVWHFIYVANANRLTNLNGGTNRATVPNAFVVSSIDSAIFVNGVDTFDSSYTPPPNAFLPSWSGHWPSTVTCPGQPGSFQTPCNIVGNPAVVPGENTAVLYAGWTHANAEPNGTYTFKFTIHGTYNGDPVDLIARSPAIEMTS
jgi:hypothetical protein